MEQAARVQRLKLHAHQGAIDPVRRQISRWLEAQTPTRLGLPADAIVLLRSVRAPWSALHPDSPADVLGQRLRRAARPAMGTTLGAGCDAVWFADEAELLACLAQDSARGQIGQRWWWQTWLGHRPTDDEAVWAWLKSARVVPAAMARLNAMGQALAWARHIGPTGRVALLQALVQHHAVAQTAQAWLPGVLSDAPPANDHAAVGSDHGHHTTDHALSGTAPHPTHPSPQAAVLSPRPVTGGAPVLLALCALLHESPHLALDERKLAARLRPTQDLPQTPNTPTTSHVVDANEMALPATATHRHTATPSVSRPGPRIAIDAVPSPQAATGHGVDHGLRHTEPIDNAQDTDQRSHMASPDAAEHPDPLLRPPSASPSRPITTPMVLARKQVTQTSHGGVFFLLNVALAWELYGDFTRPQHALLSVSPWQFLHAAANALLGRSFNADPLAGWLRAQAPFSRPRPALALGEAPRALLPESEARWLMPTDIHSPRRPGNELSCWWPLLRQRLSQALNMPEPEAIATCLNLAARIERRGERVDVCFALHHLPLTVRLAGLDRNPGWVPASGCDLRFHFET